MSTDKYIFNIEVPVAPGRRAMMRLTPVNIERHVPLFVRGHSVVTYQMLDVESNSIYTHPIDGLDRFHFAMSAGQGNPDDFYAQARIRFQTEIGNGMISEIWSQYLKRVARNNIGTRQVGDYVITEPWLFQRYGLHGDSAAILESKLRYRIQPATGSVRYSYEDDSYIERNHRYTVATVALDSIADDFSRRQEAILKRVRGM